jgi:hypothetical protein
VGVSPISVLPIARGKFSCEKDTHWEAKSAAKLGALVEASRTMPTADRTSVCRSRGRLIVHSSTLSLAFGAAVTEQGPAGPAPRAATR